MHQNAACSPLCSPPRRTASLSASRGPLRSTRSVQRGRSPAGEREAQGGRCVTSFSQPSRAVVSLTCAQVPGGFGRRRRRSSPSPPSSGTDPALGERPPAGTELLSTQRWCSAGPARVRWAYGPVACPAISRSPESTGGRRPPNREVGPGRPGSDTDWSGARAPVGTVGHWVGGERRASGAHGAAVELFGMVAYRARHGAARA